MEKKESSKTEHKKSQLITVTKFHQAIMDGLNPDNFDESIKTRYFKEKTEILEFLFYYAGMKDEDNTMEKSKSRLPLLAFSSFISSNPDFPYIWNYLIKKSKQFYDYLDKFKNYIAFVTADVSEIIDGLDNDIDITFRIDGIFTINVQKHESHAIIKCTTELDSIHKIFGISHDSYDLMVSIDDIFIGEYKRKMGASKNDIIVENVKRYSIEHKTENTNDKENQ